MSIKPLIAACIAIFSLSSESAAASSTVTLGSNPAVGGGEFSSGGGISVAVEPRRTTSGRMALCGVWAQSDRLSAYVRRSGRDVLKKGVFLVDGQVVHHGLGAFSQVAAQDSYAGSLANCVSTSLPWRDTATIGVRIPRHVVFKGRDGGQGGLDVVFAPSRHANPALLSGSILPSFITTFGGVSGTFGSED